jgi:hypothetical protein
MKNSKIFVVLVLSFLIARPAYAYIDPGMSSVLLQVIVVGLAMAAAFIRLLWTRIISLFHRRSKEEE